MAAAATDSATERSKRRRIRSFEFTIENTLSRPACSLRIMLDGHGMLENPRVNAVPLGVSAPRAVRVKGRSVEIGWADAGVPSGESITFVVSSDEEVPSLAAYWSPERPVRARENTSFGRTARWIAPAG